MDADRTLCTFNFFYFVVGSEREHVLFGARKRAEPLLTKVKGKDEKVECAKRVGRSHARRAGRAKP
jgi:hypothetical protein